ncbi:hypothetical protein [Thiorhodococcus mannitoliphagus]|uniref:hypothetical protein n=1 Tax=Thiorhodococcus mannitoliphagus TaxID=329406 RepID=UPI00197DBE17|nr:hypothetical protein [Thiorhodococcus mannitoliphagus]
MINAEKEEVKSLREKHNFSTETAIQDVARALRRHVDEEAFDKLLAQRPEGAVEFGSHDCSCKRLSRKVFAC